MALEVETDDPSMAIAAMANGYFSFDLSPAQNYVLAERLRLQFGYELVGIGSCLIGFLRREPVDAALAAEVIGSVRHLYCEGEDDGSIARVVNALTRKRWLLLIYTEN